MSECRCDKCEWWKKDTTHGECRKNAPRIILDGYEPGAPAPLTVWPETAPDSWCGEFKAKETT